MSSNSLMFVLCFSVCRLCVPNIMSLGLCFRKLHLDEVGAFLLDTTSKFALFSFSGFKEEKLIKKQTYAKTETCKLYYRVFWIFLPNVIKINPYNYELYRFKADAFFETQCTCYRDIDDVAVAQHDKLSPNCITSICCGFFCTQHCRTVVSKNIVQVCIDMYNRSTTDRSHGVWALPARHYLAPLNIVQMAVSRFIICDAFFTYGREGMEQTQKVRAFHEDNARRRPAGRCADW